MISIEYCHIDPSGKLEDTINETNSWIKSGVLNTALGDLSFGLMIDDVHSDISDLDYILKYIDENLLIKPDVIYLESSFIESALLMIEHLKNNQSKVGQDKFRIIQELKNEDVLMQFESKSYKVSSEFLLSYRRKLHEAVKPSCPALVAASYLHRLGKNFSGNPVNPVKGKFLDLSRLLNILSSRFLNVEDKAHSIIYSVDENLAKKIGWHFYPSETA